MNKLCLSKTPCLGGEECEPGTGPLCPHDLFPENILEFIDVGIVVMDAPTGEVTFSNGAAREILKGLNLQDHSTFLNDLLGPERMGGKGAGASAPGIFRFGNRLLGYSVYEISGSSWCVFISDVTEKTRLESIAEAVNAMDNIGYIFSSIRHEIGNPVNSLKMTMSVLRRNLEKFSEKTISDYIDRSLSEVSRMEYLLKSLKTFSMFEALVLREMDLNRFLRQFLKSVEQDLTLRGIRITPRIAENTFTIRIDPRALQQVLLNLLTNAKGALEGRPAPEIVLGTTARDGLVWLTVKDNGCGLSEADQQHLFKPFYTTKAEGSGLGLVISRKMLAQMNGNIEIFSQEKVGTTVVLSFQSIG